jgi:uncharacterized protein YndB with AHSA1/START domain
MSKNNKYDWSQFTQSVAVAAPVDKVFNMWADPQQLRKWFLADAKMDLKKNGSFEWEWLGGIKEYGKILDIHKPRKLSFTFAGSVCDVLIKKDKRGTLVTLHQHKIPVTDKYKAGIHLSCSCGWTFFLTNLKTFLEYGIDLRETDARFRKAGSVLQ